MSRTSKFLVGIAAALITFGGLFATLGQDHFNQCGKRCHHHMENCCMHEMQDKHCNDESTYKVCERDMDCCPKQTAKTDSVK